MMVHPWFGIANKPVTNDLTRWFALLWPICTLSAVLGLWLNSLSRVVPKQMDDLGLLTVTPVTLYAALGVLTLSFGLTLYRRTTPTLFLFLHLLLLILIIHGTPAIVYETPRYSWAWKHVGIIDFIMRERRVDPTISVLPIYHLWPGFFALGAFLTEIAGYQSAISYIGWAPVFFNLINLFALQLIFWSITNDRRLVWQSIWLFYLSNWVGQDYFSPQAFAYFMHLTVIGICLHWFKSQRLPVQSTIQRWLRFEWFSSCYHWLVVRAMHTQFAMNIGGDKTTRPLAVARATWPQQTILVFVTFLICVVATISSHQLTPFMTLLSLLGLALLSRCRTHQLSILYGLILLAWLIYTTPLFLGEQIPDLLNNFGTVKRNIDGNLVQLSQISASQRLVSFAARGLTLGVWGLAGLGAVRRLRQGYWDLTVFILAIAPLMMLIGNNYGGEIIFRIHLFTLPATIFLASGLLYPAYERGQSGWTMLGSLGLSALLLVAFLFAYWGKEQNYYFTPEEVAASEFLATTAPVNSLLIEGTSNYPSRYLNYEHFFYVSISREPANSKQEILQNPADEMERWMSNRNFRAAYLIITRSMKVDIRTRPTIFPEGGLDTIEQALSNSPKFTVVYSNEDAKIFALTERVLEEHMITRTSITQASLSQLTDRSTEQEGP